MYKIKPLGIKYASRIFKNGVCFNLRARLHCDFGTSHIANMNKAISKINDTLTIRKKKNRKLVDK